MFEQCTSSIWVRSTTITPVPRPLCRRQRGNNTNRRRLYLRAAPLYGNCPENCCPPPPTICSPKADNPAPSPPPSAPHSADSKPTHSQIEQVDGERGRRSEGTECRRIDMDPNSESQTVTG